MTAAEARRIGDAARPADWATAMRVALSAKIGFLIWLALNTRFVMDEFWTMAQTNWLWNGYFDTIWPEKAAGYVLFYDIARVTGWDSVSILLIARLLTAGLAIATGVAVWRMARMNGHAPVMATLVVLVLFSFSNFIERGFRLRSEPLALLFAALALLVMMRGPADQAKRLLVAGILSGFAFVTTQKSVYFNVALGVALVTDALVLGRWRAALARSVVLIVGWLLAISVYAVGFGGLAPVGVLRALILGPVEVATVAHEHYPGIRMYIMQTLTRNSLLYLFCFGGLVMVLSRLAQITPARRIHIVFTLAISVLVFGHDQPWPYIFIWALPFLACYAAEPFTLRLDLRPSRRSLALLLVLAIAMSFGRNIGYLAHDNRQQTAVLREAERLVPKDGSYFDGIGMIPARRMAPRLWLDAMEVQRTLRADEQSALFQAFVIDPPSVVVLNYRIDAMEPLLGTLLKRDYTPAGANLLIRRDLSREDGKAFPPPVDLFSGVYSD